MALSICATASCTSLSSSTGMPNGRHLTFPFGDVLPADQPGVVALVLEPLNQLPEIFLQVLFIELEGDSVHPGRCRFPQLVEAGPQALLIQQPVEPAKPVPPLLLCFPSYGPQGGWPVVIRRSYGTGFLCRLRCHVDPLARLGPRWRGLRRTTMDQSDSRLTLDPHFLSL